MTAAGGPRAADPGTPSGVIAPVVTPLTGDGSVDLPSLRRLLDHVAPHVQGVLVLGTSGEQVLLDPEQADQVVTEATTYLAGRVPVYAGIAATSTMRARSELRRLAHRPGIRAAFVTTGYYVPHPPEDHERHFQALADATDIPIVLYNIPQHTGSAIPPRTVHRLSGRPNIVGIKDSSGDMIALQAMIAGSADGFAVLQGREHLIRLSTLAGVTGAVSALANVVPQALGALLRMPATHPVAIRLQERIAALAEPFERHSFIAVLKEVLSRRGIIETPQTAPPTPPMAPGDAETLYENWRQAERQLSRQTAIALHCLGRRWRSLGSPTGCPPR